MQPTYLPWMGYFDMMDKVDYFVFYDDVQLAKRSWQVRNRIWSQQGELMLSIPILKEKNRDETLINQARLNYSENWVRTHLGSFQNYYAKARHFEEVYAFLKPFYEAKPEYLADFSIGLITGIYKKIGIETPLVRSSALTSSESKKDVRLAEICLEVGAKSYLSARGSADYIEAFQPGGVFSEFGVSLFYHAYEHPVYSQRGTKFLPYLGIVDLLFNEGFAEALRIIRSGRKKNISYLQLRKELNYDN